MKSAKEYLEREVQRLLGDARDITRKAEDENRNLTDDEKASVEEKLTEVSQLKSRVSELETNEKLQESIDSLGNLGKSVSEPADQPSKADTIGQAFIKSEAYAALKERGMTGRWSTGPVELITGAKAPGDIGTGETVSLTDSPNALQPQVLPGIQGPAEQRLTVADLFAAGTTSANSIEYLEESVTTNGAASVSEGGEKPASYLEFDRVSEPVRKLATFLPVSDEMLEDEAAIASYITARLALFVRREEEDQLLNGNGTGSNLSGILDRAIGAAVAADIGGTNAFDAVMAGITDVRVNAFLEPDAMIVHPQDHAEMAILRAAAGDGGYFSGGPYTAPAQNPWGLRAVVTTAIAQGTVLVGAFAEGGQVFRRSGLTVEASNSHEDFFRRNLTAIRAEERLALAVYRPAAFSLVTLPA